jgi:hypothetical protein
MRRPTLAGVPAMPTLPAPLVLRRARVDEAAALARLLGRAYEAEVWESAHVERELLGDPTVRETLVVSSGERLMATASLQVRPDTRDCGRVRWVARARLRAARHDRCRSRGVGGRTVRFER